MKNNAMIYNTNTAAAPTAPAFTVPPCRFAEDARCRTCGFYSVGDSWCYCHKTWTFGDKWACSSYK